MVLFICGNRWQLSHGVGLILRVLIISAVNRVQLFQVFLVLIVKDLRVFNLICKCFRRLIVSLLRGINLHRVKFVLRFLQFFLAFRIISLLLSLSCLSLLDCSLSTFKFIKNILIVQNSVCNFIFKILSGQELLNATLNVRHAKDLMDRRALSGINLQHALNQLANCRGEATRNCRSEEHTF